MHFLKEQSFFDRITETCKAMRDLLSRPSLHVAKASSDTYDHRIKGIHPPTSGGTEIVFSTTRPKKVLICKKLPPEKRVSLFDERCLKLQ